MIEEFSGGYYRTKMTVQPVESGPVIERGLYDFIEREFYYKTDAPITMRTELGEGKHFLPSAERAMPTDVLGLPEELCETFGVHPSSEGINVFVLKPEYAYLFSQSEQINSVQDVQADLL
jgi:hypothetical protein